MLLQDLALDVLQEITSRLEGRELYHLWLCGCKSLQLRLSEGGAARKFTWTNFNQNTLVWPSFACSLSRLVIFRLEIPFAQGHLGGMGACVACLPATLTSLTLQFPQCLEALYTALMVPNFTLPNLTYMEMNDDTQQDEASNFEERMPWPKNLITLTVSLTDSCLSIYPSMLPSSLTTLTVGTVKFEEEEKFPVSLTDITLECDVSLLNPSRFFSLLPSGLLRLQITPISASMNAHVWDWNSLPRHLETLIVSARNISPQECALLPRSLTSLMPGSRVIAIAPMGDEFLDFLPPLLTYVEHLTPQYINTKSIAQRMPRMLKRTAGYGKTSWWSVQEGEAEAICYLPPKLSRFKCNSPTMHSLSAELHSLGLESIPVELEYLELSSCVGLHSFAALPKTLQGLFISHGPWPRPAEICAQEMTNLKLTTLNIKNLVKEDRLPCEKWNLLPRTLETLLIATPDQLHAPYSELLPRNLKTLRMFEGETNCDLQVDWFKLLPPSLHTLDIASISSVEVPNLYEFLNHHNIDLMRVEFPPSLFSLKITFTDSAPTWIISSIVSSLPLKSNTCELCLPQGKCSDLKMKHLSNLPPSLVELQVPKSAELLASDFKVNQQAWISLT